jgi:hypothetical protein
MMEREKEADMNRRYEGNGTRRGASVLLLAMLSLAGCDNKSGVVTGTVRYGGRVLTMGTVSFYGGNGDIVSSLISADGTYRLARVAPGTVRVVVVSHPRVPPALQRDQAPATFAPALSAAKPAPESPYTPIPERYQRPETSGLHFVVERGDQVLDLDLTP